MQKFLKILTTARLRYRAVDAEVDFSLPECRKFSLEIFSVRVPAIALIAQLTWTLHLN